MGLYEDIPAFVLFALTIIGIGGLIFFAASFTNSPVSNSLGINSSTGYAIHNSNNTGSGNHWVSNMLSYYPYAILLGVLALLWLFGRYTMND